MVGSPERLRSAHLLSDNKPVLTLLPSTQQEIELSNSTAAVFLTVYPYLGFGNVTTDDFTALGNQILGYETNYNRTTFLRYAPEMQGLWNKYGQQPTEFISSFQTMYTTVKNIAPNCKIVWAPNTPQGYPYGQGGTDFTTLTAADQAALDTYPAGGGDGELTADDDSLSPYWPGENYVDWIGISLYYKGPSGSDTTNTAQTPGYCGQAINGINPATGVNISNWYGDYCLKYPSKPCMFAESGAAYHLTDTSGDSQLEIQTAWINDCITNTSMLETFGNIKMIMQFEYEKTETSNDGTDDLRDYRVTNNTEVLSVLQSGLSTASAYWEWAASQTQASSISSVGQQAPQTYSNGETITNAITATTRGRPTTFPSLFGLSSAASQVTEMIELSVLVASGLAGALAVMRFL